MSQRKPKRLPQHSISSQPGKRPPAQKKPVRDQARAVRGPRRKQPPPVAAPENSLPDDGAPASAASQPTRTRPAPASVPGPGFGVTWEAADEAIVTFKLHYLAKFPFVIPRVAGDDSDDGNDGGSDNGISSNFADRPPSSLSTPSSSLAQRLSASKPFLLRVILLVAASSSSFSSSAANEASDPQQRRSSAAVGSAAWQVDVQRSVLAFIGQHVVVLGERRLEILQGMLVFIAWGNLDFYRDARMTSLIHLAIGYAHNLGLTSTRCGGDLLGSAPPPAEIDARMRVRLDGERALLGCYYLLSINSTQFGRRTPQDFEEARVDECIASLGLAAEFPTDFVIEKRIRLQQLVSRISDVSPVRRDPRGYGRDALPNEVEQQGLNEELERIMDNIARNRLLSYWATFNFILVRLYAPAASWATTTSITGTNDTNDTNDDQQDSHHRRRRRRRLLATKNCHQATRAYLTAFLSLSPADLLVQPFPVFSELLSAALMTCRLHLVITDQRRQRRQRRQQQQNEWMGGSKMEAEEEEEEEESILRGGRGGVRQTVVGKGRRKIGSNEGDGGGGGEEEEEEEESQGEKEFVEICDALDRICRVLDDAADLKAMGSRNRDCGQGGEVDDVRNGDDGHGHGHGHGNVAQNVSQSQPQPQTRRPLPDATILTASPARLRRARAQAQAPGPASAHAQPSAQESGPASRDPLRKIAGQARGIKAQFIIVVNNNKEGNNNNNNNRNSNGNDNDGEQSLPLFHLNDLELGVLLTDFES